MKKYRISNGAKEGQDLEMKHRNITFVSVKDHMQDLSLSGYYALKSVLRMFTCFSYCASFCFQKTSI